MNCKSYKNSSSKYKGVTWYKEREKWMVRININKKHIFLGYFESEIEAAKAYNDAAIKYYGEYARLNEV